METNESLPWSVVGFDLHSLTLMKKTFLDIFNLLVYLLIIRNFLFNFQAPAIKIEHFISFKQFGIVHDLDKFWQHSNLNRL